MADSSRGPPATEFKDPAKSGWLTKQGGSGFKKNWRRRWFVLDDNYMYYYKTPEDREPAGIISLDQFDSCTKASDDECRRSKFCWRLGSKSKPGTRTYYAYADSKEIMQSWVDVISGCLVGKKADLNVVAAPTQTLNHLTKSRPMQKGRRAPSRKPIKTYDEEDDEDDEDEAPTSPQPKRRSRSKSTDNQAPVVEPLTNVPATPSPSLNEIADGPPSKPLPTVLPQPTPPPRGAPPAGSVVLPPKGMVPPRASAVPPSGVAPPLRSDKPQKPLPPPTEQSQPINSPSTSRPTSPEPIAEPAHKPSKSLPDPVSSTEPVSPKSPPLVKDTALLSRGSSDTQSVAPSNVTATLQEAAETKFKAKELLRRAMETKHDIDIQKQQIEEKLAAANQKNTEAEKRLQEVNEAEQALADAKKDFENEKASLQATLDAEREEIAKARREVESMKTQTEKAIEIANRLKAENEEARVLLEKDRESVNVARKEAEEAKEKAKQILKRAYEAKKEMDQVKQAQKQSAPVQEEDSRI
eukprot:NODE_302_length_1681_cov_86.588803_g271_i0.p1 GENE.NODE_302_length_1681_cov_86.588803_g271_i0~~NODE_302_length_1681_cov_86.588803_g271_i0.p1  ORF type:complete len:525 (-),score=111.26 NODE_302_length_1681_cov_86.588803_g271_i0:52-1626(-)